jgi:hypothetical protein
VAGEGCQCGGTHVAVVVAIVAITDADAGVDIWLNVVKDVFSSVTRSGQDFEIRN